VLAEENGYDQVKFFFLLTFAAAIRAIVSGGIAERARFNPQLAATLVLVGFVYPIFEGMNWNGYFGVQAWLESTFGHGFHDFAGSVVVHAMGGCIALPAVLLLGAHRGRYTCEGLISSHPPSNIPFLALGAWILTLGWFGFNVMSAQMIEAISGLVAVNSQVAMIGGTLAALVAGRSDPGFIHNGPLVGLVALCSGSDLMHPLGVLATGTFAGGKFVWLFTLTQNKSKNNDMLGVWPRHGICGAWGGLGGVSLPDQILGTLGEVAISLAGSAAVYGALKMAWDCGSIRRRSSWAPISASTRCRRRRSARPAGSSATPLLQVIASFDCQLFELAIDEHDVRMLFGVFQQQLGALEFQFGLFTIQT
jgi:ammonium transporter, Amt family